MRAGAPTTLLVALYVALLLAPSADHHLFSGLPLSAAPEFLLWVLLLPLIASRGSRRLHGALLDRAGRIGRFLFLILGGLALVAKIGLFWSGTSEGFRACYRSPLSDPPAGRCEMSYENALARFAATRINPRLAFGPEDWNLSFFNSLRFNFYEVDGSVSRSRLPFLVSWQGEVPLPSNHSAELTYVGEGAVDLGRGRIALPASYAGPSTVVLPWPEGRARLSIDFRFDDGYRIGHASPPDPYAIFVLHLRSAAGTTRSLGATAPPLAWRLVGWLVDGVLPAFGASVIWLYAVALRKERMAAVVLAVGAAVVLGMHRLLSPATARALAVSGICVLLVYMIGARVRRMLLRTSRRSRSRPRSSCLPSTASVRSCTGKRETTG